MPDDVTKHANWLIRQLQDIKGKDHRGILHRRYHNRNTGEEIWRCFLCEAEAPYIDAVQHYEDCAFINLANAVTKEKENESRTKG